MPLAGPSGHRLMALLNLVQAFLHQAPPCDSFPSSLPSPSQLQASSAPQAFSLGLRQHAQPQHTHTYHFLYHRSTGGFLDFCLHLCKVIFSWPLCCDFFPRAFKHQSFCPSTACLPCLLHDYRKRFPIRLHFCPPLFSHPTPTSEAATPGTLPPSISKPSNFS